jgi:TfoX/Sxy family transcriptional regulator of competence genes
MAYDNYLYERVANTLRNRSILFDENKMFGGVAFMVNQKMCVGVMGETLMARIDPAMYEESLKRKGCHPMEFTGRPMKGYVTVTPEGMDLDEDLEHWIGLALEFNPRAKSSKKKHAKKRS